jgi:hypothetical protein
LIQHPKSHWPPPQDPEFVPDGWLPIFEAYKLAGRALFPDEWLDGQELAVPSDEEIAANREVEAQKETRAAEKRQKVERAKKASAGVMSGSTLRQIPTARTKRPAACRQGQSFPTELVQLINDETARKAARERGDRAWNQLRQWLYDGIIPAVCLDDEGQELEISNRIWARRDAITILHTNQVDTVGYVFLSQAHLETAICGEDEPEQPESSGQAESSSSNQDSHTEKTAPSATPLDEAERPEIKLQETPGEKRKRKSREKYRRWYDLAQVIKSEGRLSRPTEIANAIEKRETKRLKGKGVTEKGLNRANIRRRLDQHYPGWSV